MKRVRADCITRRSIIDWVDGVRARVVSVRDVPGGVVLKVQPDRIFSQPVELRYRWDEWVTVVGYSVPAEGWQ